MNAHVKRRAGLATFLRHRRARLHPEQFSLPTFQRRRTPGLRREELAQLVGVGVSWYTWLEQGRDIQVSDQVLERLASILQLTREERRHLFLLARDAVPAHNGANRTVHTPSATEQAILDGFIYPAILVDDRLNVVAWNTSATRVFGDYATRSERERNMLWFHFMHPSSRTFRVHWEQETRACLAALHSRHDRSPDDPWFNGLIAELQHHSSEFRAWWSAHDVVLTCSGRTNEVNHPQVGRMVFTVTVFPMPDQPELQLVVYTPLAQADTPAKLHALAAKVNAGASTIR